MKVFLWALAVSLLVFAMIVGYSRYTHSYNPTLDDSGITQ
jgi:hypothetical protein